MRATAGSTPIASTVLTPFVLSRSRTCRPSPGSHSPASLPDAAWDLVPPGRRAAAALDWHPEHGDRCRHLVFTSPGPDRDGLASLLDSCLLTDAEYAAGRTAWQQWPSAFNSLLEV